MSDDTKENGYESNLPEKVYRDDAKVKAWIAYVQSQVQHIFEQGGMER